MYAIPLQSDTQQIVERKIANVLTDNPLGGAAILAAASAQDVTFFPTELRRTLFTEALIRALSAGAEDAGDFLALDEVCQLTIREVSEISYGIAGLKGMRLPRPELHILGQRSLNVGKLPFFPNAASPRFRELRRRAYLQNWASEMAGKLSSFHMREAALQQTTRAAALTWLPSVGRQQTALLRRLVGQSSVWAKTVRAYQERALDLAARVECETIHDRELDVELLLRWLSIKAQMADNELKTSETNRRKANFEWGLPPGIFGLIFLLLFVIISPVVLLARREFSFEWLSSCFYEWTDTNAKRHNFRKSKRVEARAELRVEAIRALKLGLIVETFERQKGGRSRRSFGEMWEAKVSRHVVTAYCRRRIFIGLRIIAWVVIALVGLIVSGVILIITGQIPAPGR